MSLLLNKTYKIKSLTSGNDQCRVVAGPLANEIAFQPPISNHPGEYRRQN